MRPGTRAPSVQVLAPALLIVGVLAATLLFLRTQPEANVTPPRWRADRPAMPADEVHAAVGVGTEATRGDVAARFQQQVEALEAEVAAAPLDRGRLLRLARLFHDGHRVADAVPLYRRAMALDPTDANPYYDLAAAHAALGDWEAAAGVLEERLDQNAGDAVALYDLGAVRANQGRADDARRLLREAQKVTSDGALGARISEALARLRGA